MGLDGTNVERRDVRANLDREVRDSSLFPSELLARWDNAKTCSRKRIRAERSGINYSKRDMGRDASL
jgi:hypothetical protein